MTPIIETNVLFEGQRHCMHIDTVCVNLRRRMFFSFCSNLRINCLIGIESESKHDYSLQDRVCMSSLLDISYVMLFLDKPKPLLNIIIRQGSS